MTAFSCWPTSNVDRALPSGWRAALKLRVAEPDCPRTGRNDPVPRAGDRYRGALPGYERFATCGAKIRLQDGDVGGFGASVFNLKIEI